MQKTAAEIADGVLEKVAITRFQKEVASGNLTRGPNAFSLEDIKSLREQLDADRMFPGSKLERDAIFSTEHMLSARESDATAKQLAKIEKDLGITH